MQNLTALARELILNMSYSEYKHKNDHRKPSAFFQPMLTLANSTLYSLVFRQCCYIGRRIYTRACSMTTPLKLFPTSQSRAEKLYTSSIQQPWPSCALSWGHERVNEWFSVFCFYISELVPAFNSLRSQNTNDDIIWVMHSHGNTLRVHHRRFPGGMTAVEECRHPKPIYQNEPKHMN